MFVEIRIFELDFLIQNEYYLICQKLVSNRANDQLIFLDSSAAEQSAVNRSVAGSNPARGATLSYDIKNSLLQTLFYH